MLISPRRDSVMDMGRRRYKDRMSGKSRSRSGESVEKHKIVSAAVKKALDKYNSRPGGEERSAIHLATLELVDRWLAGNTNPGVDLERLRGCATSGYLQDFGKHPGVTNPEPALSIVWNLAYQYCMPSRQQHCKCKENFERAAMSTCTAHASLSLAIMGQSCETLPLNDSCWEGKPPFRHGTDTP